MSTKVLRIYERYCPRCMGVGKTYHSTCDCGRTREDAVSPCTLCECGRYLHEKVQECPCPDCRHGIQTIALDVGTLLDLLERVIFDLDQEGIADELLMFLRTSLNQSEAK